VLLSEFGVLKHQLRKQKTALVAAWLWARQMRLCSHVFKRENKNRLVEHLPVIVRKNTGVCGWGVLVWGFF